MEVLSLLVARTKLAKPCKSLVDVVGVIESFKNWVRCLLSPTTASIPSSTDKTAPVVSFNFPVKASISLALVFKPLLSSSTSVPTFL